CCFFHHASLLHAYSPPSTHVSSTPTSTTEIYPLSLHDALPIYALATAAELRPDRLAVVLRHQRDVVEAHVDSLGLQTLIDNITRSEEHTSELQSRFDLVCRLLLEKKKIIKCMKLKQRDTK